MYNIPYSVKSGGEPIYLVQSNVRPYAMACAPISLVYQLVFYNE